MAHTGLSSLQASRFTTEFTGILLPQNELDNQVLVRKRLVHISYVNMKAPKSLANSLVVLRVFGHQANTFTFKQQPS